MSRITIPATWLRALSLALIVMCASAPIAGANMWTNPIPHAADYEGKSNGDTVIEDALGGWSAETNTYTTVSNMPVVYTASNFPLDYNHSNGNVVKLDTEGASISNLVNDTGNTNVWIDTMIQMVPTDGDVPSLVTNGTDIQTGIWLGTNGMLSVIASEESGSFATYSNILVELSHTAIETGSWHRLTVVMDYKSANFFNGGWYFGGDLPFFKVILDGSEITDAAAYTDPSSANGGSTGGAWFLCANQTTINKKMSAAVLSGTGYFDDFVVTNGAPTFVMPTYYTNGVPGSWLAAHSLPQSDGGALTNSDTDVFANWEEWLMGTDPTVSNDFEVTTTSNGGTNWIWWQTSGYIDPGAPDIQIRKSTDLGGGFIETNTYPRSSLVDGTNMWEDTSGVDGFYQLRVTTD